MKKIAFFVQWMLCGGVENALIALTNELVRSGNDVTIYVIKEKGDFLNKVSNSVHLKAIPMDTNLRTKIPVGGTKITVRECLDEHKYWEALRFVIKHNLNKNEFAELNLNLDEIPELKEHYDIAVNYHMHSPFLVWYLSERVTASKKYTWIHNDFETTKYSIDRLRQYLNCVDQFFAVSNQLVKEFINIFPEFKEKISTALNIVPKTEIVMKSEMFYPEEYKKDKFLKLLTVGRLEEQKGYDIAIDVCSKLKNAGLQFQWYILGDGTQRKTLETEIQKEHVEDCFHLLGTRMNPYPYFKNCDIYVQTSRHEGYVTTVSEAKIFKKPIVTTDVSGAREQLRNGINGSIVEINTNDIYMKLRELMESSKLRQKYRLELEKSENIFKTDWLSFFE